MKKTSQRILLLFLGILVYGSLMNSNLEGLTGTPNIPQSSSVLSTHSNILIHDNTTYSLNWFIDLISYDTDAYYSILKDGVLMVTTIYSGQLSISYQLNNLTEGNHLIVFILNDGFSTQYLDSFEIYVNFSPILSHQPELIALEGDIIVGTWSVTDNSLKNANYSIKINHNFIETKPFSSNPIQYQINNASYVGINTLEIIFNDGYGKSTNDTTQFILNDIPVLTSDHNSLIVDTNLKTMMTFFIADSYRANSNYTIKIDGSEIKTESISTNQFSYTIPSLSKGTHSLSVIYNDGYGESAILDYIIISQRENYLANKYPSPFAFTSTTSFTWTIAKGFYAQGFYDIYIDGVKIVNSLGFTNKIQYSPTSLSNDVPHILIMIVTSVTPNVDFNIIELVTNEVPILVNQNNASIVVDEGIDYILNWTIEDNTIYFGSASYQVKIDGNIVSEGNITDESDMIITFNLASVSEGEHTLIFTFYDGFGGSMEENISLTINKTTSSGLPGWAIALIVIGSLGSIFGIIIVIIIKKKKAKPTIPKIVSVKVDSHSRTFFFNH